MQNTMKRRKIERFDFPEGKALSGKFEVLQKIGEGWEGEVYLVRERETDIERAVKFFFPHRNPGNRTLKFYATKLHKLRHCPILIQYHTQDMIQVQGQPVQFLISEFVEGELLSEYMKRQPGGRLQPFQALHLLHALVKGVEQIHSLKEYHGDIHMENIIIERYGLGFDLKLIDLFRWSKHSHPENMRDDICDMINVFYASLGGKKWYVKHDNAIKSICCGLKRSLILKKFRTVSKLRSYIETLEWK